jgi:type I restriction enzyme M protein
MTTGKRSTRTSSRSRSGNRRGDTVRRSAATNGHADLLKELWEAAVRLRGSIEPADYKRYVLPIIFLRFLSLRFEKRRSELDHLLQDPSSDYFTSDAAERASVLEDPDEYRSAGAFIVPPEARWDAMILAARRDDFKKHLDDLLQLLEDTYPEKLRGLLPRIYAGSNLEVEDLRGLVNIFSRDVFKQDHEGEDLVGRVYEYFIGEFANSEGKRGGEYFTPVTLVRTLVAMLEPTDGVVFDPCCGSGGMFVQSDLFTRHSHQLSFVGQESKDFTYRLCRMNLFIHGVDGNIELGNSYTNDKHHTLRADFVLANPPFNDGAKSREGWGADKIPGNDPRLVLGNDRMQLSPRNGNTMWILHFLYHLKDSGTAGFVMASGELASSEAARQQVRKAIVDLDYVDCIVQLSSQLFANTQIPCSLWFVSKNRDGKAGYRKRTGEILFIDGRNLGSLIPGSRKQKQLSEKEIETVASVYRHFKRSGRPESVPGFCRVATVEEVREKAFALAPGRYVGAGAADEEESFEDLFPRLKALLRSQISQAAELDAVINATLEEVGDDE